MCLERYNDKHDKLKPARTAKKPVTRRYARNNCDGAACAFTFFAITIIPV